MRVVIQRVNSATVSVHNKNVGLINKGLLLYVGFERGDTRNVIDYIAEKILNFRIFPDSNGKMGRSILEVDGGSILSISQFTLASNVKRGRRPDFTNAMEPDEAETLYNEFNLKLSQNINLEKGIFGATMNVLSVNDGPVTFILEKKF